MLDTWSDDPGVFPPWPCERYTATFRDPARVRAVCEQYRAATTVDVTHDETDRGAHRLRCPVLALERDRRGAPVVRPARRLARVGRRRAGRPARRWHFLPEEAPAAVIDALRALLVEISSP